MSVSFLIKIGIISLVLKLVLKKKTIGSFSFLFSRFKAECQGFVPSSGAKLP